MHPTRSRAIPSDTDELDRYRYGNADYPGALLPVPSPAEPAAHVSA